MENHARCSVRRRRGRGVIRLDAHFPGICTTPVRHRAARQDRDHGRDREWFGLSGGHRGDRRLPRQHGLHRDLQRVSRPGGQGSQADGLQKELSAESGHACATGLLLRHRQCRLPWFAHLEKGASATQKASYYFQGQSQTSSNTHEFTGAYDDNWQATDTSDIATVVWSPCGELRNFNINTELRANAGTSDTKETTSFIAMDSTDGDVSTTYHFAWKECPPAEK